MKISQENFIKAWENKKLISGALKAAHVYKKASNYEDLYNEAVVVYAQMLELYPEMPIEELDKLSFRKIIWKTTDELRKMQRHAEHCTGMDEAVNLSEVLHCDRMLMIKNEVDKMSKPEQKVFYEHMIKGYSITDLSRDMHYTRMSLYRMKKHIVQMLREVFR